MNTLKYSNTYWKSTAPLAAALDAENTVEAPWGTETVRRADINMDPTRHAVSERDQMRLRFAMLAKMPLANWSARVGSFAINSITVEDTEIQRLIEDASIHLGGRKPQYVAYSRGTLIHGATAETKEDLHRRVAAIVDFCGDDFDRKFYATDFQPLIDTDEEWRENRKNIM